MQHVHPQMAWLGNEILHLELFQKPMNLATLNEICAAYQPTFTSMEYYTAKSSSILSTTNDVVETLHSLPEAFLEEYVSIHIPRDGNCLFHAISQVLNETLNVTRHLPLLAVSVFISSILMFPFNNSSRQSAF